MYIFLAVIIAGGFGFFFGRWSGLHSGILDIIEKLMREEHQVAELYNKYSKEQK